MTMLFNAKRKLEKVILECSSCGRMWVQDKDHETRKCPECKSTKNKEI